MLVLGQGCALALVVALGLPGCAADVPAGGNADAEVAAAEAVIRDFFDAQNAWDYDALRATVTSDFELVEDTVVMSIDDFIGFIRPFQEQGAEMTWELSDHDTEIDGDVAWTRYTNRAVMRMNGGETRFHWIESAVLTRLPDGSWKIDRLQSNPVSIEGALTGT